MYFYSRIEAGQKLAAELLQYSGHQCVVVSLSESAILVAEQIAAVLHCKLALLLTADIQLPGEQCSVGTVSQDGSFSYNAALSQGEIDEYYGEFHGYIEDQKREKFQKINRILSDGGELDKKILRDSVVILVSDGLKNPTSLVAAEQFLKPLRLKRLVIAMPIASVPAVDKMHIMADELHCMSVTENYISTNHYYDDNDLPTHQEVIHKINNIY